MTLSSEELTALYRYSQDLHYDKSFTEIIDRYEMSEIDTDTGKYDSEKGSRYDFTVHIYDRKTGLSYRGEGGYYTNHGLEFHNAIYFDEHGEFEDLLEFVEEIKDLKTKLEERVKSYVQSSAPLEKRWEVFMEAEVGSKDPMFYEIPGFDIIDFYDDLNWDRYKIFTAKKLIDKLESIGDTTKIKEHLLKNFIFYLEYDW